MKQWTPEQEQAIWARNSNLLVAAAAGSGKTAVLVERIIQLIVCDRVSIDRLLIVTFTNAAAGEMRERISAAIMKEIENAAEDQEHLRQQLQLLSQTSISTLHAFCTELVREHFHLLEIDPRFRIADSAECELLKLEAVEEILEEAYELSHAHFLGVIERFGGSKYDTPVQNLVLRLFDFMQSKPEPEAWLKLTIEAFQQTDETLAEGPWVKTLCRDLAVQLEGAGEFFSEALALIDLDSGLDGYRPAVSEDLQLTRELEKALEHGLGQLHERLQTASHSRLGRVSKETDPVLQEQVKDLRDEGKKLIQTMQATLAAKSLSEYARDLRELYPYMQALADLVLAFAGRYQEKKTEKGVLDFNDLEHYALRVLSEPQVAETYRNKYLYVFVDEYQDSNLVQETILNYIKRADNLFMVGDVKQSIYRFRLADPSLFIEKYQAFKFEAAAQNRRIDLGRNFRSRAAVIDGVNTLFKQIMSSELGEIAYDESAYLNYGCSMEEVEDARIEVMLIEKDQGLLELEEEMEEINEIEIEARFIAGRIKELLGQMIYDPRLQQARPLDYRDMVILMRSTQRRAAAFMEVFSEEAIPAYADVNNGYFEALEVEMFLNLLRIIDNKRQDIPLLSVMRSPIGRFTVEELIAIRVQSQAATYYEAVEEYLSGHADELQAKLADFMCRLQQWKDQSRYIPIDELIWKLLLESGYYHYVGAMPGGVQRQANLRILFDRARQFQETSLKGLFHFLKFIDKLKTSNGDMGMARVLGENDNVVRIMSIHKSKGLEFPVVFLAGMGKQFNLSDSNANILLHKDLGIGPRYIDPEVRISSETIARLAMKSQIRLENLSEEMRILYVAMTRPVNKLIMTASLKNLPRLTQKWSKSISPFNLGKARTFMDWVGPVLMRHPDGEILRDLAVIEPDWEEIRPDDSCWKIDIVSPAVLSLQAQKQKADQAQMKQQLESFERSEASPLADLIKQRLNWQYPYAKAERIPSKLSVSSIKNMQGSQRQMHLPDPPSMLQGPDFIMRDDPEGASRRLSGAERGTVMHFVMQHLDLQRVGSQADIEAQLAEMLVRELLTEEETAAVQIGKILRFFQSELGSRILQSPAVYREVPFNMVVQAREVLEDMGDADEALLIQGVIDLYFREGEELVLVDYKTDYISSENRSDLIQQYSIQLRLYRTALERILGRKVKESYLYLFYTEEKVKI